MGKQQTSTVDFLRTLFEPMKPGLIELRAIHNSGDHRKVRRVFTKSPSIITGFADQYGAKDSEYNVYYGVCKRASDSGKKADVLGATALWADVDCLSHGQDIGKTAELVMKLPVELQPSTMVHSGGGLHLYWFLDDAIDFEDGFSNVTRSVKRYQGIEDANKVMMELVGGDNVHDVTRILRLPGTWNNKRAKKAECKIIFHRHHIRYDIHELLDAAIDYPNCIVGDRLASKKLAKKIHEAEIQKATSGNLSQSFDELTGRAKGILDNRLREMWTNRVREHAPRGYIGVHEALTLTLAKLYASSRNSKDAAHIKQTETLLKLVPGLDTSSWDMQAEHEKWQRSLDTWKEKWPELKAEADRKAREAKNGVSAKVQSHR